MRLLKLSRTCARARSSVTDGNSTPVSLAMLLELRTLEQRLAHEIDLRIDILIGGEPLQGGLQRGTSIDEYARFGLISVGQREHHGPARRWRWRTRPPTRSIESARRRALHREHVRFPVSRESLEPRFRHDQHVARLKRQVLSQIAAIDQCVELDLDVLLLAVDHARCAPDCPPQTGSCPSHRATPPAPSSLRDKASLGVP